MKKHTLTRQTFLSMLVFLILFSACDLNQNSSSNQQSPDEIAAENKKKELELKQRELDLKEKELQKIGRAHV